MKRCPECQRTYSDDTMTFCLADGSLLSAPYDPQATQHLPEQVKEPPPTEVMQPAEDPFPILPERPDNHQQKTILADGIPVNKYGPAVPIVQKDKPNQRAWLIGAGLVTLFIVGVVFAIVLISRRTISNKADRQTTDATGQNQLARATPSPSEEQAKQSTSAELRQSVTSPAPTKTLPVQNPAAPSPSPSPLEPPEQRRPRAEELLRRARAGENFASLARRYSDDASKGNGGDLGWFKRGVMVKPFEDAAFGLKPGQISGVVQTQYGYCIIKVEGKRTAIVEDKPEEQVHARFILIANSRP
jgi:PPIC-type PPIASE domain